jgi:pimeloyl-ACP methyl ester carboxylesterase
MEIYMTSVTVSGSSCRVACRVSGPDEVDSVLLLHGWGSSADSMLPIQNWLSDRFHVVNVDLPGHGHSPAPPQAWGVEEHVEMLRQIIENEIDGSFSIVGHSNGGRLALHLASDSRPVEGLMRLALISPSGIRRKRTAGYFLRRGIASALRAPFLILPAFIREEGLDWLRHSLLWRALGSADYRKLDGVMRETFVRTVNSYVEDRLERISLPILLFRGTLDSSVSEDQMTVITELAQDSGLVSVHGAGHYAHLDRPDIVRAGLLRFLGGVDRAEGISEADGERTPQMS